ncbi:Fibrous sheath-interacting protein 2 [Manis javanica]|nr:Fibrous sheath-interacting protein 2 [Manis javanica]
MGAMDLYLGNCRKAVKAAATKAAACSRTAGTEQCDNEAIMCSTLQIQVKSFINLLMILTCLILTVDFWKSAIKAYTVHVQKHTVSEETPSRDERSAATPPAVIKKQLKNKEISCLTPRQAMTIAASDQELLTKHRYLDLISRELRKVDHMAEKQTKLRLKEDGIMTTLEENLVSVDKLKRNGRQRKCYLGQRLEKEDIRREARVEEQHKKMREIANRKMTNADLNGRKAKNSSLSYDSGTMLINEHTK